MTFARSAMPRAIGVILPSSNRIVERAARSFLEGYPDLDACFSRVPYGGHPPDGYELAPFRQAAALLAQARPDVLVWNATRGALLGFEPDRRLGAMIEAATGIPFTTTALAALDLMRARSLTRIGVVAQGRAEEGERLAAAFGREGIAIVARVDLEITDNLAAAAVSPEAIEAQACRLAATTQVDAVLIWSTNLAGYRIAAPLGARLGLPVLDSATIGFAGALARVAPEGQTRGWGIAAMSSRV